MMLRFRALRPGDFPLLLEWLSKEHVRRWWNDGDDTLLKVAARYGEEEEGLGRFILVEVGEKGEKPLGYFQHYLVSDAVIGLDQFIGEEDYLNQGVGTEAVRMFVEMLRREHKATAFILDPSPDNRRAIRCYEKAGFRHYETRSEADGSLAYMMQLSGE